MKKSPTLRPSTRAARILTLVIVLGGCYSAGSSASPARTSSEITTADARQRIFLVADDSMQGRRAGTIGNYKMTSYLEREVSRLGLEPAGENGTFYQVVPIVRRTVDSARTSFALGNTKLRLFEDFAPLRPNSTERYGASLDAGSYGTVYGGRAGDSTASLAASDVAGRIVVLDAPMGENARPTGVWGTPGAISVSRFPTAAGIAIASLELATAPSLAGLRVASNGVAERAGAPKRPFAFLITSAAARQIMGKSLRQLEPGAAGTSVTAGAAFIDQPVEAQARNVIAIVPGSDPSLRGQYVAIGAHSDHVGIAAQPVEHDSLRAYYSVMRPEGAQRRGAQPGDPTRAQLAQIRTTLDSLRRLRPARMDSINNGADDDGSGSVALLEIAESLAEGPRPRRSILLIWHTAEESGLLGSAYFTENPTVPRDSIVAQLNMDMVGRGLATDIDGGGPRYLQVIGSRRLSTDLGNVLDSVNARRKEPFRIDYSWDAPGHVMSRYCRSDHFMYARRGIPIAYLSRGYHRDYHVVTDEPQYISYEGIARVAGFVRDVALGIANREQRLRVDKPLLNPLLPCRQ